MFEATIDNKTDETFSRFILVTFDLDEAKEILHPIVEGETSYDDEVELDSSTLDRLELGKKFEFSVEIFNQGSMTDYIVVIEVTLTRINAVAAIEVNNDGTLNTYL